jgi:secreted PhoX family phosphatase
MSLDRRTVLRGAAVGGVGFAAVGAVPSLADASPVQKGGPFRENKPFPPLMDDPKGLLALPPGFKYTVVTHAGETKLKSGQPTPTLHDGTAAFSNGHDYVLIQNHEIGANDPLGVPQIKGTVYDAGVGSAGGCTVISVDRNGKNKGEWVGISGTLTNCAGGPTPWGTWMTCEETESKANGTTILKDHGYVFEVWGDGKTANPVPLKALGRYAHEALAIGNDREHIYLSEDASGPNGLFYRWSGPRKYRLDQRSWKDLADVDFGTLEAMAILGDDGKPIPDVAYLTSAQLLRPFRVAWVPVPDRDAVTVSTRKQFTDGQVTRGKKFEGVYGTHDGVYVVNSFAKMGTTDIPADGIPHEGMIWFYNYEAQTIQLVAYFPANPNIEKGAAAKYDDFNFDAPDNVTVTPWGSLVLAEDGLASSHVLSTTPGGPTYAIARNMLNDSEFTGPTFSDDGKVLFVNIQTPGITLAITGPWRDYLG